MKIKKYPLVTLSQEVGTDIVFIEYHTNLNLDIVSAKELVASRLDFTLNKPHYLIVDVSNIKYFSPEVKTYMQHPEGGAKNVLGGAFIASNLIATLLANVFIRKIKDVPVKFFPGKKDALLWIHELKQIHLAGN